MLVVKPAALYWGMRAAAPPLIANLLCLDLVNTRPRRDGARVELLERFADLVEWLRAAGRLSPAEARRALERWDGTAEGTAALAEARRLRSALQAGAERMAAGRPMTDGLVRAVNRVLSACPAHPRLVRRGGRVVTRPVPVTDDAVRLLAPVAESAAWLLEHGDPALVRRCGGAGCVLLFYDTTKNRSRRWCSMDGCGSRAKAGAYYRRRHPPG
jgi:predicted RNA-binding Zn ribbon-like protein